MFDPENPNPSPEDDGSAAAAAQAAATAASEGAAGADAADAFSQGVEAARAEEAGQPATDPPAQVAADAQPAADGAASAVDGKPDPAAAGGDAATPAADPPAAPDAVDAEIKDLGITNERTQKRFRELSERAAEVETLRPLADRAQQWQETIESTGSTPEQFGNALNYLAAINSRDPAAMSKAYEFMQQEMTWLAKELGKPAPGYDPLTEHADLAAQVTAGDMTRQAAEEVAQARRLSSMQQQNQQRQRQAQEQTATQQQAQQVALQQVAALGAQLRSSDPHFAARFKAVQPMVAAIRRTLPPSEWAAAIRDAYAATPVPAPVAAPPPAAPQNPARPSGVDLSRQPTKEDAFAFGVAQAQAQGR